MSETNSNPVSVRYMIDDVEAALAFYTKHLDFRVEINHLRHAGHSRHGPWPNGAQVEGQRLDGAYRSRPAPWQPPRAFASWSLAASLSSSGKTASGSTRPRARSSLM